MADRPRFGPAGVPPIFHIMKATLTDVPRLLREEGLDAFEYQASRWGAKPQIKREDAEKLGSEAKENDVWLSLHGSYFINLCGERDVIEASRKRLIACITVAEWMRAHVVVFHAGFYGERSQKEAFAKCVEALKEVAEIMRTLGNKNVKIGPETMGKRSQLGSLDEVLSLCEEVEQTQVVIDWGIYMQGIEGASKQLMISAGLWRKLRIGLEQKPLETCTVTLQRLNSRTKGKSVIV